MQIVGGGVGGGRQEKRDDFDDVTKVSCSKRERERTSRYLNDIVASRVRYTRGL